VTVIAGIDVGNATTEVVLVADGRILGAGRAPTRGRKGSPDSLRGAAAVVRRLEREAGCTVSEARIAPLRAVDTAVLTLPELPPSAGRLRVLGAGVPTPGGTGACVGVPVFVNAAGPPPAAGDRAVIAVVPDGMGYDEAAGRVREMLAAGWPVRAVLVASDEGVLVANRVPAELPVFDQVDARAAAGCELVAVEVRPPGRPLSLLTDPVALGAAFGLDDDAGRDAVGVCRALADYHNALVGLFPDAAPARMAAADEPWVVTREGERISLRAACEVLTQWAPGAVRAFDAGAGISAVDDLFAVDLPAATEAATARRGSVGRAVLVASLGPVRARAGHAELLSELLSVPVNCPVSEPAASRRGALTTPGARDDAVVVDLGAGTIDVIGPDHSVVLAGAGELLTAAVAETLGISRAAADWVKRGPCIRIDGGQRYEAEDGSRGFLDIPAPASAAGMLAVNGPGGLLPFDRRHGTAEWRALRIRSKEYVVANNLRRAMRQLDGDPSQLLVVGGPAGDEELLGVLARSLPAGVAIGRGNVGGDHGPRYAVALGLALT